MTELDQYRARKDEFFRAHPSSPLTPEQQVDFAGLNYFPENPNLRLDVVLLPSTGDKEKEIVYFDTTGNTLQPYTRVGRFRFKIDDEDDDLAELTIFANERGLFLPFVDALAGTETYPAGRYLEPEPLGNNTYYVDFNLAYNPYCAYNDQWTCPITPAENRIAVPIEAGEKIWSLNP